MVSEPLTETEGTLVGAILASFWGALNGGELTVEKAMEDLGGVQVDRGDGTLVEVDTPQGREGVSVLLSAMSEDIEKLVKYLYEHPTKHSSNHLSRVLGIGIHFVSVLLYRLEKQGFVNKTIGHSTQVTADGLPLKRTGIFVYQINVAAWLKEMRRRETADGGTTADR
jgi:DNA-binding transcriptional regulator YhcF (GntR family)